VAPFFPAAPLPRPTFDGVVEMTGKIVPPRNERVNRIN
jgi:hypothetical protein